MDDHSNVCSITLSANAGVSIRAGGTVIWVDALHDEKTADYSTLTAPRLAEMRASEAFARPDAIIFTHNHRDHYSAELAEEAAAEWPEAKLVRPWMPEAGQESPPETVCFDVSGAGVKLIKLPHEGEEYTDVANYACLISYKLPAGCFSLLILGDAELGCSELTDRLGELGFDVSPDGSSGGRRLDAVIADFPWAAISRARRMLDESIRPAHLLIYHLPFEEDDRRGWRDMTRRVVSRIKNIPDVRIFEEFLQTETL